MTKRLPILAVPKKLLISLVRYDMVNLGSDNKSIRLHALGTIRMLCQIKLAFLLPLVSVSSCGCRLSFVCLGLMLITIAFGGKDVTSSMSAWSWYFIHDYISSVPDLHDGTVAPPCFSVGEPTNAYRSTARILYTRI